MSHPLLLLYRLLVDDDDVVVVVVVEADTSVRWREREEGGGGAIAMDYQVLLDLKINFPSLDSWSQVLLPLNLEQLQRCSVCDLAKIFLTSKFSYFIFSPNPHS